MKKLLIVLALLLCASYACAHPGRTDASGGHTNHSTGEYHYHHGYPAHQHDGGVCPYDFDDKTGQSSGSSSSSTAKRISNDNFLYSFLENGDRGEDVRMLQERLNALGYSCGAADGIFGTKTEAALKAFQEDEDLPSHGWASYLTMCRLFPELAPTPTPKPTSTPRPTSTPKPTRTPKPTKSPKSSKTSKSSTWLNDDISTWITIALGVLALPLWGLFSFLYDEILKSKNRRLMAQHKWTIERNHDLELIVCGRRIHSTDQCKLLVGERYRRNISDCVNIPALPCPDCMSSIDLTNAIVKKCKADERQRLIEQQIHEHEELVQQQTAERKSIIQGKIESHDHSNLAQDFDKTSAVYISRSGNNALFHHSRRCRSLETPIIIYRQSALALSYSPCPDCSESSPPDVMVAVSSKSRALFHDRSNKCISTSTQYLIPIEDARQRGLCPCSKCFHYFNAPIIYF